MGGLPPVAFEPTRDPRVFAAADPERGNVT